MRREGQGMQLWGIPPLTGRGGQRKTCLLKMPSRSLQGCLQRDVKGERGVSIGHQLRNVLRRKWERSKCQKEIKEY